MEELIKQLLTNLKKATEKKICKWRDGTEEGEYYVQITKNGILFSKNTLENTYKFSTLNEAGVVYFTAYISAEDDDIFAEAEKLYNTILQNNENIADALNGIISDLEIEKKEESH